MYNRLMLRLKMCRIILLGECQHWVLLNVDKKNLLLLLKEEPYKINSYFHGVRPFIYFKMLEDYAATKDDVEMICDQAVFDANVCDMIKEMKP